MDSAETPRPGLGLTIVMGLVWIEACLLSFLVLVVIAVGCDEASGRPSYCNTGGRYSDTGWFVLLGGWALLGVLQLVATTRTRKTGRYRYAVLGALAANAVALFGWRILAAFS
jgi:hypothetical protein